MRGVWSTMGLAFAEAYANRRSFWSQVSVMAVNDVGWVAFWVLFFHRTGDVRGWDASRALLLLSILATGAGIVLGLLSNSRRVGKMAAEGELDAVLALPVPPLAYLLVRQVDAVNLGDLLVGPVMFVLLCHPTPSRTAIYLVGVAASATILVGFLVATGSLAFFVGRGESGDMGFNAMLLLANYPADIFSGATKLVLYSVVPAAFVSSVPARLIDDFDLGRAAAMLTAAVVFAVLGATTFTLGLRRYSSGSVWTRA